MYAADDTDGAGDDYVTYVTVAGSPIRPVGRELPITDKKLAKGPGDKMAKAPDGTVPRLSHRYLLLTVCAGQHGMREQ